MCKPFVLVLCGSWTVWLLKGPRVVLVLGGPWTVWLLQGPGVVLVLGGPWTVGLTLPLGTLSLGLGPVRALLHVERAGGGWSGGAAQRAPVHTGHRRPGSSWADPLLPGAQVEAGPGLRAVNTGGTILWPQQTVRSSCWSSLFNGIRPQPTHKRFSSAYLQNKFLICRKITGNTLGLDKTFFLLITSHHNVLEKKIFWKQKKIESDFRLGTPPPNPPS